MLGPRRLTAITKSLWVAWAHEDGSGPGWVGQPQTADISTAFPPRWDAMRRQLDLPRFHCPAISGHWDRPNLPDPWQGKPGPTPPGCIPGSPPHLSKATACLADLKCLPEEAPACSRGGHLLGLKAGRSPGPQSEEKKKKKEEAAHGSQQGLSQGMDRQPSWTCHPSAHLLDPLE